MVEMCQVAGNRDQLITLLLPLVEHVLNIILIHFQDRYVSIHIFSLFHFFSGDEVPLSCIYGVEHSLPLTFGTGVAPLSVKCGLIGKLIVALMPCCAEVIFAS